MLAERPGTNDGKTYEKLECLSWGTQTKYPDNWPWDVPIKYRNNWPLGGRHSTQNNHVKRSNHKSRKLMLIFPIKYREYWPCYTRLSIEIIHQETPEKKYRVKSPYTGWGVNSWQLVVGSMQVLLWIRKQIYLKAKILYYGQFEQRFQLLLGTEKHVNSKALCVRQIKQRTVLRGTLYYLSYWIKIIATGIIYT
jgi:hypothetical protein